MLKISGLTRKTCLLALFITLPVGPSAILLMNLKTFYIPSFCLGNFNINTLVKSTIAKEYLNLIHSEGFNPLILEATRVTESTTSCINHILSNFVSSSTSGSIAIEIADHLPVFALSYDPTLSPFPNKIEIRDFKRFDKIALQKALRNTNWTLVYKSSDVQENLTRFFHTFNSISNRRYSYSPTALGRETSQHDCEAEAGDFLAKTQTNIG